MTNALVTEETKEKVGQLYNNGYKTKEIADYVNYSIKTIEKIITELHTLGKIGYKTKYMGKTYWNEDEEKQAEKKGFINEDGTVRCCSKASQNCVYGYDSVTSMKSFGLCGYILAEGKSRGCDPNHCTKFVKRTKSRQRKSAKL